MSTAVPRMWESVAPVGAAPLPASSEPGQIPRAAATSTRDLQVGFLSAILAVALFVTTLVVQWSAISSLSARSTAPFDPDFYEYQNLARSLAQRGVFAFTPDWASTPQLARSPWTYLYETEPTTIREPGYPVLLALIHSALGDQTRALQAALTLCNALTVVLCFLLGALLFRWPVGLLAAAVCALDPSMVYTAARLGREPMLALLTTAGVLCAFMAVRSERIAWALVAGAAFALLAYFKETGYVTCGILAAWMLALGWRRRLPLWKPALAMLACTLVLVLPWMARNTLLRHRTVTMSSIAPMTLSNGLGTSQIWASHQPDAIRTALDPWSSANPADAERRLLRRSLGYIEANPREAFATIAYNAALFWSPLGRYSLKSWAELSAAERFGLFYHGVLLSVSLLALWSLRRSPYAQGVALLLVVMTAMHSPFDAGPRYRVAFEPLLVVFFARIAATWARQASGMRRVKTTSERKKSLLAVVTHPTGPSHPPDKRDLVPPRRDP